MWKEVEKKIKKDMCLPLRYYYLLVNRHEEPASVPLYRLESCDDEDNESSDLIFFLSFYLKRNSKRREEPFFFTCFFFFFY